MAGMILNFTEEEYAKIPKPRRTWVMKLLRLALEGMEPVHEETVKSQRVMREEAPRETSDENLFGG